MARLMNSSNMNTKVRMVEKERDRADEDLGLFRELRKRQNERFLQYCASEESEYEPNIGGSGKFALYRIPSGKKEYGLESLEETNKNEYDWLKTPPATPLFPSLEMEPSAQLVVQMEIPFSQPISRFAGNDVEALKPKATDGKPNHNRQRPATRSIITNKSSNDAKTEHNTKSISQKQSNNADLLALKPKKSMEGNEPQRKPKTTRGVSPSVRSRIASNYAVQVSNEAPPNLRTEQRASSTARARSTSRASKVVGPQNSDPSPRSCRPSRSPSPRVSNGGSDQLEKPQQSLRTHKETFTLAARSSNESGTHFVGSKMVEKVVKARKHGINQAEKETKPKPLKYRV